MIESKAFTTSLDNSSSGRFGESKSSDGHLWDIHESNIIGDGGDGNDNLILTLEEVSNLGDGDWWSVDSGGDQSSKNGLAERRISSSGQESEQSDEKMDVQVL